MKRALLALLVLVLLTAHFLYWYYPRERAVVPHLRAVVNLRGVGGAPDTGGAPRAGGVPGTASAPSVDAAETGEPLAVLASGAYDACLWLPYPHQNLGALSSAVADLPEVIAAAVRLSRNARAGGGNAGSSTGEPEELPGFGPFEVPPADEIVACTDLAGGRMRVVARIYPGVAMVAKLAGHLAGNPWLAGGDAGRLHVAWTGRLWSVTAGTPSPPWPAAPPSPASPSPASRGIAGVIGGAAASATAPPMLPESLAVVHWSGVRAEIPAGYYALTRAGASLSLSLVQAAAAGRDPADGSGGGGAHEEIALGAMGGIGTGAESGASPVLVVAVGPDWRSGELPPGPAAPSPLRAPRAHEVPQMPLLPLPALRPTGPAPRSPAGPAPEPPAGPAPASPAAPAPASPAALALFETGSSRLSSLGDLPGLAVFNVPVPAGRERWGLPGGGVFHLLSGRLPSSEQAGWHITALDRGSLRQAEALAPRLAALMTPGAPAAGGLSLGFWLEPRATLRVVTRIRRFVEDFPLASRGEIELWRNWETVLEPLAHCRHAALTASSMPPSMRLVLETCTAAEPRAEPQQ